MICILFFDRGYWTCCWQDMNRGPYIDQSLLIQQGLMQYADGSARAAFHAEIIVAPSGIIECIRAYKTLYCERALSAQVLLA